MTPTPPTDATDALGRRQFLRTLPVAGAAALAGCSAGGDSDEDDAGSDEGGETSDPPVEQRDPEQLPDGVYVPRHADMMEMIGMETVEGLQVMLSYTAPHPFWTVTGDHTSEAAVQSDDAMHLMVSVRDAETGLIAPDVEPTVTVYRDGAELGELAPWPMLSQPMGFHFGDNVPYGEQGEYRFEVSVSTSSATMPDDLAETFRAQTAEFVAEFRPADAADLESNWNEERYGEAGAMEPMSMEMGDMTLETTQQPAFEDVAGDGPEPQYTDDAALTVRTSDEPGALGADTDAEQYLVVPAQTRYNRYLLPNAQLSATATRDGEEVASVELSDGLHPDYGHYYGAGVPALEAGDEVTVEVATPPQVSRHEGYERAFLEHEPLTFTL